jgi:hypothetical protein
VDGQRREIGRRPRGTPRAADDDHAGTADTRDCRTAVVHDAPHDGHPRAARRPEPSAGRESARTGRRGDVIADGFPGAVPTHTNGSDHHDPAPRAVPRHPHRSPRTRHTAEAGPTRSRAHDDHDASDHHDHFAVRTVDAAVGSSAPSAEAEGCRNDTRRTGRADLAINTAPRLPLDAFSLDRPGLTG